MNEPSVQNRTRELELTCPFWRAPSVFYLLEIEDTHVVYATGSQPCRPVIEQKKKSLKKTQESMNNVSCRRDMTEILLKAA